MSYGSRARIGYTCPIYLAEIFIYDFYKMVPDGVSLVTATSSVWRGTQEEMKRSAEQSIQSAFEMAKNGVNVVVFGGVPVGFQAGYASVADLAKDLQEKTGVPVTTSLLCQNEALKTLRANKVVVLGPSRTPGDRHMNEIEQLGCTLLEVRGIGREMYAKPPTAEETIEKARSLLRDHPDADTLHCPSPHWAMAANIEALEREFPIQVVTAGQAIVWHALRMCGIQDRVQGYGRLFREH